MNTWQRRTTFASNLFPARSDINIFIDSSLSDPNQIPNNDNSIERPRRARSMFNATKYSPS